MDFIVIQGDIADQHADALVGSTSSGLHLSGGAARALLQGAGDELAAAAEKKAPVDPGNVAVTDGFDLDASHVIHAVTLGATDQSREAIIRQATHSALEAADQRDCHSLVFPALGAGIGNIPLHETARYMTETIDAFEPDTLSDVRIIGLTEKSRWDITEVADEVRYGDGSSEFTA